MAFPLHASFDRGEAVLRFPYHDGLRRILRAIPRRRWDPEQRAWRVPLDPASAEALSLLLAALSAPTVTEGLARQLRLLRRKHNSRECLIDLARPDEQWWLSFPADRSAAPVAEVVQALMEHPESYEVPGIGRALVPLDEQALRIVSEISRPGGCVRLTRDARHALTEVARRDRPPPEYDGEIEPRPARPPAWRGSIDIAGGPEQPVLLLLGNRDRLPPQIRERAAGAPGGASLPASAESWELIRQELGERHLSPAARRCIAALAEGRPLPPSVLELSAVHEQPAFVLAPGHDLGQQRAFAALPGALPPSAARGTAHEHARLPAIHADPFCVPELDAFLSEHEAWIDPPALEVLQEIREQHAQAAGIVALSHAQDAEELAGEVVDVLGGELKPFQRAGVRYLLGQRRALLADEQGLGKTIQALAAIEAADAYPAIVLCPASLKLNWAREAARWLPHRKVQMLSGLAGPISTDAEITLLNYDVLHARQPALSAMQPQALVLDESHYCKNAAAKRTQAAQRLAGSLPADGVAIALTGTPVMNAPKELISQLRILGRLADFGSGAAFGRRFRGADAHLRLHWHLRARCFVRRLKADVLPQLPAKTRSVVPVELDNEPEYRLAERDVVAWLRSQPLDLRELDAKVAAALRAERLVRLNALKLLAAEGKLHAALAWIHDFLSSGERLVVFAHHRSVQQAVVQRFPQALHILGSDSHAQRDQAVRAFQERPDGAANQLIVCSMEVGGQGLTLTRASNVAFLELDWTPAKHDQAEDRCHRIGQQDAVNATYLLAAETIDETIAALLERKRAVIGAVTDGRPEDGDAVIDALVRELRGAPYRHLRAVA